MNKKALRDLDALQEAWAAVEPEIERRQAGYDPADADSADISDDALAESTDEEEEY